MASNVRGNLILYAPILLAIVAVLALGGLWPADPPAPPPGVVRHTIDRGGLIRWDNGKADVETTFQFTIDLGNNTVPVQISDWRGEDFPINLEAYTSVAPEVLVNRLYRGPGGDVAFAVIGSI